jgi:ABC-2 type transport system ATP-binding protein
MKPFDSLPADGRAASRLIPRVADAISVRNISKSFPAQSGAFRSRSSALVLSDVSLSVRFGEIVGILGHNGAGKTTLLEILATLILPSSGTAAVCGHDVVRQAAQARSCLAYSGAAAGAFYPRLTGEQNLELFAVLNDLSRAEAQHRVAMLLDELGLADARTRLFQTYSEGMKHRLSLARALVADPQVLLLDEPTRSFDGAFRHHVHGLLRRRIDENRSRAVVLVTHSLAEAEALCDRVCVLDRGSIAWVGPARAARGWVRDVPEPIASAALSGA